MKLKWLGHASFLITGRLGAKLITDPYAPGGGIGYGEIKEAADADIVTISHDHFDHNYTGSVAGSPAVVKGKEVIDVGGHKLVKDVDLWVFPTYHDPSQGNQRGENAVFCFTLDRVKVCHLGDLGHPLSDEQIAKISSDRAPVHVLLIPVGGTYTIDAAQATELCRKMKPNVVIPMHYKTPKVNLPIALVDDFLKGKSKVKRVAGSEVELRFDELPAPTEIWLLNSAL